MPLTMIIAKLFEQQFGEKPTVTCYAPSRVNIIGDHTDYNDGFVLPAAINYGTTVAAAKRDDMKVHVYSHDCDQQSADFSLDQFVFKDPNFLFSRGLLVGLNKPTKNVTRDLRVESSHRKMVLIGFSR